MPFSKEKQKEYQRVRYQKNKEECRLALTAIANCTNDRDYKESFNGRQERRD
jgi:pyrroloquinoline quinone (PQQ) biosynthesis protein C